MRFLSAVLSLAVAGAQATTTLWLQQNTAWAPARQSAATRLTVLRQQQSAPRFVATRLTRFQSPVQRSRITLVRQQQPTWLIQQRQPTIVLQRTQPQQQVITVIQAAEPKVEKATAKIEAEKAEVVDLEKSSTEKKVQILEPVAEKKESTEKVIELEAGKEIVLELQPAEIKSSADILILQQTTPKKQQVLLLAEGNKVQKAQEFVILDKASSYNCIDICSQTLNCNVKQTKCQAGTCSGVFFVQKAPFAEVCDLWTDETCIVLEAVPCVEEEQVVVVQEVKPAKKTVVQKLALEAVELQNIFTPIEEQQFVFVQPKNVLKTQNWIVREKAAQTVRFGGAYVNLVENVVPTVFINQDFVIKNEIPVVTYKLATPQVIKTKLVVEEPKAETITIKYVEQPKVEVVQQQPITTIKVVEKKQEATPLVWTTRLQLTQRPAIRSQAFRIQSVLRQPTRQHIIQSVWRQPTRLVFQQTQATRRQVVVPQTWRQQTVSRWAFAQPTVRQQASVRCTRWTAGAQPTRASGGCPFGFGK